MSLPAILGVLFYLFIVACICALLWWFVDFCAAKGVIKAPFIGVLQVVIAAIAVCAIINLLLGLMGTPIVPIPAWRH